MALLLKASSVEESVYAKVKTASAYVKKRIGRNPTLATVLVGEDPASQIYVRRKGEMCVKLGLGHRDYKLAVTATEEELLKLVRDLSTDDSVDGILVQRPLPSQIRESLVFDLISPEKDVDCFSPYNVGLLSQGRGRLLPCTPAGVMEILKFYKINPAGKNALVVGRSDIVGKPASMLLLQAHATVTTAHSKTKSLADCVAAADIVIAAIGKARFLSGDLPWKRDCVVIDVGMNRGDDKKLSGDVDFDAVKDKVAAITPVPGGVGPMTIAMLMVNTVRAAIWRKSLSEAESGL